MQNYAGEYSEYVWRLPVGSDSNYEQRCGREVLHWEANNELHNSGERKKFYEVASVKGIKRLLALMALLTNKVLSIFKQINW